MADKSYPVTVTGELTVPPGRWLWLFKWLLAIPHLVIIAFLLVAFIVVWIIAFFAIVFTGRFPRGLFDFNVGVLRWMWRVDFYTYWALGTDKYPPFTLKSVDYPADLQVEYPEKLSRGLVWIKLLLAIPHYIVVTFFQPGGNTRNNSLGLVNFLAIFGAIVLLFAGKYPESIFKLVIGMNRWTYRVCAYAALMTDQYPPFRLWDD